MPTNILYYVHDPMCSWCWAYRPTLANLRQQLAPLPVRFAQLLGGLAPDSNAPMPAAMQAKLQHIWRTLEQQVRSEEHTSELQSRFDLVCRLLLEKKNETVQYTESTMS